MTFEVVWIYYDRALNNLIMSYTIWKTKTLRIKCNNFHFLKLQQIKMNYIGNAKGPIFLGAKPTSDEFCHKFGRKLWFLKFFNMLSESGTFAWQVPSYWLIWKLPNFAIEHKNSFSGRQRIKIPKKISNCYSTISQLIKRKLQYIVNKILLPLNVMLHRQWNKRSLHVHAPIIN